MKVVSRGTVRAVHRRLLAAYGRPDLGNQQDPLDELVFIMLSTMTTGPSFGRVFATLKAEFPTWEEADRAGLRRLERALRPAGLSHTKARRLRSIFRSLRRAFGRVTLGPLQRMSDTEAEAFLLQLPGVGVKTARCVLMYSLGRAVFPVDTHSLRITRRLGWTTARGLGRGVADALQDLVPAEIRHDLHVATVVHGRTLCRAVRPRCAECPVLGLCRGEGVKFHGA